MEGRSKSVYIKKRQSGNLMGAMNLIRNPLPEDYSTKILELEGQIKRNQITQQNLNQLLDLYSVRI